VGIALVLGNRGLQTAFPIYVGEAAYLFLVFYPSPPKK
jgi:hypothetical protein